MLVPSIHPNTQLYTGIPRFKLVTWMLGKSKLYTTDDGPIQVKDANHRSSSGNPNKDASADKHDDNP